MSTKPEQLADAAAGASIATFLGLSLGDWDAIVHIAAGIVAIIAGIAAALYHLEKRKQLKRKQEPPNDD